MKRLVWLSLSLAALVARGESLSSPSKTVMPDPSFLPPSEHRSIPKWERGFLIGYDTTTADLFAADMSGKRSLHSRLWPENTKSMHVMDMTAAPRGGFAAAISVVSQTGAASHAIAWLDANLPTAKLVQVPK